MSFPGRHLVRNFVILGLWQDVAFYQITGIVIGASRDYAIAFGLSHARQAQQLLFGGSIQIEWLVAAPALADSRRHSLSIALHFGRCLRGFLLQFLRVLWLSTACECGQQKNCGNVPISEEVHFDQPFRCLG